MKNKGEALPPGCLMVLVIIFLASLIDGLDASIVTVALPTIANDFDIWISDSSWVVFVYVVALAALLLPMGKMAKNNRIKKFMIIGTVLFGISSVMCGLSTSFLMLVLFRLMQGVAAAMMSCVLPCMIVHMLPVDRKGLGLSVMGASSGVALILGPSLGGFITSYMGWNWIFFINVPICLAIILLTMKYIPRDESSDGKKDPTLVGGVSALIFIGALLMITEDLGDPDLNQIETILCAVLIVISLPVLIWSIRRDSARAVIAPKMLLNKEYLIIGASFLLCTMIVSGAQYLLPFLMQGLWLMSSDEYGLYLTIVSVAMVSIVLPVGNLCDKYGCKYPSVAAILLRSGFCIGMLLILLLDPMNFIWIVPAFILFGMSHAFSGTAQPTRMIHHATPGYEDEASTMMLVINYVASALGCVLFVVVFDIASKGIDVVQDYYITGFTAAMWFALVLLAIAMVCTLSVKNKIVRKE